uniref:Uncharacterized protein n=1 Tax=Romanomermis culicivorax TaxID=13658 RepID=A0A915JSY1_ROMCU
MQKSTILIFVAFSIFFVATNILAGAVDNRQVTEACKQEADGQNLQKACSTFKDCCVRKCSQSSGGFSTKCQASSSGAQVTFNAATDQIFLDMSPLSNEKLFTGETSDLHTLDKDQRSKSAKNIHCSTLSKIKGKESFEYLILATSF